MPRREKDPNEIPFTLENVMAVGSAIIGLATLALIVSRPPVYIWRKPREQPADPYKWIEPEPVAASAADVIEAAGKGFADAIRAATSPVVPDAE